MRARLGAGVQPIFRTFRELDRTASSSQFDDAMMRALRMTVAALHKRMNKRFSRLGRRIDERFKAADARIDARFKAADARFDARFKAADARFDGMDARFDGMDARFGMMDRQLGEILRRIELLAAKFDAKTRNLEQGLSVCKRVLDEHEERIRDITAPSL
jgi:chromosome segregation ATPase